MPDETTPPVPVKRGRGRPKNPPRPRKPPKRVTAEAAARVVELVQVGHTVASAAKSLGYDPTSFTKRGGRSYQAGHPDFAEELAAAMEVGTQLMERELYRRAVDGWDETHQSNRGELYTVRKYDTTALIFALKARRPDVYRDNQRVEHTGPGGEALEIKLAFVPQADVADELRVK